LVQVLGGREEALEDIAAGGARAAAAAEEDSRSSMSKSGTDWGAGRGKRREFSHAQ
jgi:hypothetical protein